MYTQVVAKETRKNWRSRLEHFESKGLVAKAKVAKTNVVKAKVAKANVVKAGIANAEVAKAKVARLAP